MPAITNPRGILLHSWEQSAAARGGLGLVVRPCPYIAQGDKIRLIDGRIWVAIGEQQYDPKTGKTIYGGECRLEDDCLFYAPIVIGRGPRGEGNPATSPLGPVGSVLYVRETFCSSKKYIVGYKSGGECGAWMGDGAGGNLWIHHGFLIDAPGYPFGRETLTTYSIKSYGGKWRPSTQMPHWAARTFLKHTGSTVRQFDEITEEEASAAGVEYISQCTAKDVLEGYIERHYPEAKWFWLSRVEQVKGGAV